MRRYSNVDLDLELGLGVGTAVGDVLNEIRHRVSGLKTDARTRIYETVPIERVPFATELVAMGGSGSIHQVQGMLIPNPPDGQGQGHSETLTRLLPLLPNIRKARAPKLVGGKGSIRFIGATKEVEDRHLRALWLFGNAPDAQIVLEDHQILVTDPSGTYGISDGKIVGGPYNGSPVDANISREIKEGKTDALTDQRLKRLWLKIKRSEDKDLITMFRVVYTRSLWDPKTLLMLLDTPPAATLERAGKILERIKDDKISPDMVCHTVRKILVPHVFTSSEYTALIPCGYHAIPDIASRERAIALLKTYLNASN